MENETTVLIADDHPIFRRGLSETIASAGCFEIVGEAEHGELALQMIRQRTPDLAVLDIDMPGMTGLEVAEKIQSERLPVTVVILTSYKEESIFNRAMDIGVKGYILKENAINELTNGLMAAARGETFLSPSISSFLLKRVRKLEQTQMGLDGLTPMELRVLRLVADNLTSKEIADRLFVSPRTVDTHRNNMCRKLELRGNRGLLLFALEHREELRGFKLISGD